MAVAFRAEDGDTRFAARAQSASQEPILRSPSPTQIAASDTAKSENVQIEWSESTGTPSSVRGRDLLGLNNLSATKQQSARSAITLQQKAISVLNNISEVYGIRDASNEFQAAADVQEDNLGFKHVRVAQLCRGLRVVGGDLRVHFNTAGAAYQVTGDYVKDLSVDPVAKLTSADAVAAAQKAIASRGLGTARIVTSPELVVYALKTLSPSLAYELVARIASSSSRERIFRCWVDAGNGTLLNMISEIKSVAEPTGNGAAANVTGNLLAGEGGNSITVPGWRENTGIYYLYNKTNLWYIYNVASSGYVDSATYAYRPTSAWGTSDRVEVSAARNMDAVQSYFRTVHGRNSIDNSGMYGRAEVHYGFNHVNAYWDGSKMVFGDGDGVTANSLAVLDVTGHEVTHGVTDRTAGLIYQDESGALNESFSDIFGAIIEFYAQSDGRANYPNVVAGTADWLVGEDCWISSKALRDMRDPSSSVTVGSGSEQPKRYKGTYWYYGSGDNGGVHYNSGVQNRFFYLLCEGGSGNNDGIAYSVTGIGINNARLVAYRALTVYCTQNTDYAAVRNAWISAAQDLNAAWVSSVQAAWDAVGVAPALPTVAEPQFTPPAGAYPSAINVSIASATTGAVIRYTVDGSEPTEFSTVYTAPLPISSDTTIKAKAFKTGYQSSSTSSAEYTFLGALLYNFPMDSSPGWTVSGLWAFGQPTGSGGAHGSPDPSSGYTGSNVLGYNLSGDYDDNMPATEWVTTPAINLASASKVKLSFRRWLGVEQPAYDHAYIEVSNDGSTWTRIWENTAQVADSQWTLVTYDISSVADQQSTVFIRWGMGTTDSSWRFCGWNIDDVQIYGVAVANTPPTAPSQLAIAALSSASTKVSWQDNSNNEQGFAVERKLASGGSWQEIALTGANQTSFDDSGLTANTAYVYRCRAYNAWGASAYSNEGTVTTPSSGGDSWDSLDDTVGGATLLPVPSTNQQSHGQHTLSAIDLADWFKVFLVAGKAYNFNSVGGSGDSFCQLYSDNLGSVMVAYDDDSGGSLQFSLNFTPSVTGYYYLKARAYSPGSSLSYSLNYSGDASLNYLLRPDFDNNGRADFLWRRLADGALATWLRNQNGTHTGVILGQAGSSWKMAGFGDFNNDSKVDLLWRNEVNGQTFVWMMDGTTIMQQTSIQAVSTTWELSAVGDFNNDGQSDILWRQTSTGLMVVWMMNGTTRQSAHIIGGITDANWQIAGVGNFDGQGVCDDIVWNNRSNGGVVVWNMNGISRASHRWLGVVKNMTWLVRGTTDLDGDGQSDIMWHNESTGATVAWYIVNQQRAASSYLVSSPSGWRLRNK